ncbi:MAG TPA: retropepsin-like aspartic protease [Tepidisphaeraceae bacterium]|nr:retropepsin-like aspartic protease [Tepidisphaeraceae bacterium]
MFRSRLCIMGCIASLLLVPFCRAEDTDADALKSKDLTKTGTTLVLPAEQEVADGMKSIRILRKKVDDDNKTRAALEKQIKQIKGGIAGAEYQKRGLLEQFLKESDVTIKNNLVAKINILDGKIKEATDFKDGLESKVNAIDAAPRQQFVDQVLDLFTKADEAQSKYKELADDPDVKGALEKLNAPGKPKLKLGPSTEFLASATVLKKWRGDVSSDTIQIKHEHEVPMVEVTFNGTTTREMVIDSGASMVCLTADLAHQLKMIPGDKDPTIHFTMADGKVVEAKQMVIKSVRVGQFTVEEVECAVLPDSLVAAEPLLGGTFLNNFIFKVDPKAGELHLAVIAGGSRNVTTAGGGKDKDPKKPGDKKPEKTTTAAKPAAKAADDKMEKDK